MTGADSRTITLLFLGSGPRDHPQLDLTGEFDELEAALAASRIVPRSRWNKAASDLPELLDQYTPQILHFSGHGSESDGLLFVDDNARAYAAAPEALARVFEQHGERVCCVVLNACYSLEQAQHIARHVDAVVGISDAIFDAKARGFTAAFYRAVSRGLDIQAAFERAKLTLELSPLGGHDGLQLLRGSGPDLSALVLLPKLSTTGDLPASPATRPYARTAAWSSLAERPNDGHELPRKRLREGLEALLEVGATLVGEPEDLDPLWELVDHVAGDALELTPCEAYVLGGALLTHELCAALVAYPGGREELRRHTRWQDSVAQLMRRERLDSRSGAEVPEAIAAEADRRTLRALREQRAGELPKQEGFSIDEGLRASFAESIAQVASSLWWPAGALRERLGRRGPPGGYPSAWTVDLLRLAGLLQAVDAAHIQGWTVGRDEGSGLLVSRMQQVLREGDQLQFGAAEPFAADEAPAWWATVEALRQVDAELRSVDALFQATERPRLAARRVAAVDDLRALQRLLPVQGWEPVDTRVRVSDIPRLIERLGGRALYGHNSDAPLRELIQNAADAIRARRVHEDRSDKWGRIDVARGRDERGQWLEVRDDGVGMSRALLTGPLLDFGVSYWASELSCEEFPGLYAAGFRSVGEFGIGFFSIFMLGPKVEVRTRSCRGAQTLVLEFERGLANPPLLREARAEERLVDPGTSVRVWLEASESPLFYGSQSTLVTKCQRLCPTLDVDLYVREADDLESRRVLAAGDWLELPPGTFLQRLAGPGEDLEETLTRGSILDDDFELARVLALMEPLEDPRTGEIVGRACLRPPWFEKAGGLLVNRGLRLDWSEADVPFLGVLEGTPSKAARDEGRLSVDPALLQSWYEAQEAKVASSFEGHGLFEFASVLAPAMTKPITELPILWGRRGWTASQLAAHRELPPVIVLVSPDAFEDMSDSTMMGSRRRRPVANLPEHTFMMCAPWVLQVDDVEDNDQTFILLLSAIAAAWGVELSEVVRNSLFTRVVGGTREAALPMDKIWGSEFHILKHPNSRESLPKPALRKLYRFIGRLPNPRLRQMAANQALGRGILELANKAKEERRKKKRKP